MYDFHYLCICIALEYALISLVMERETTTKTRTLIRSAYDEVSAALAHNKGKAYIQCNGRSIFINLRNISKQEIYAAIANYIGMGHSESTIQKYVSEYLKEKSCRQ